MKRFLRRWMLGALMLVMGLSTSHAQPNEQRGALFDWGNYAMFIHWELYSKVWAHVQT